MKNFILSLLGMFCFMLASGQSVGIGENKFTPHNSAALEIRANNKGLLLPRLTESERLAIESPANGLLVYQTDVTEGFYYYSAPGWQHLSEGASVPGKVELELNGTTLSVTGGNSVDLDMFLDNTDVQKLSLSNDTLYLSNGGFVVLGNTSPQTLTLSNGLLQISNGNEVNLSQIDNDEQVLTLDSTLKLGITNGNTVDISHLLQELEQNGDTLRISGSNYVVLPQGAVPQELYLNNDTLSISGGDNKVYLGNYTNTDEQTLLLDTSGVLSITGGNNVDISGLSDNMGNHSATSDIMLNNYSITNTGGPSRISINKSSVNIKGLLNVDSDIESGNTIRSNQLFSNALVLRHKIEFSTEAYTYSFNNGPFSTFDFGADNSNYSIMIMAPSGAFTTIGIMSSSEGDLTGAYSYKFMGPTLTGNDDVTVSFSVGSFDFKLTMPDKAGFPVVIDGPSLVTESFIIKIIRKTF